VGDSSELSQPTAAFIPVSTGRRRPPDERRAARIEGCPNDTLRSKPQRRTDDL
jgi:hypothetical protein